MDSDSTKSPPPTAVSSTLALRALRAINALKWLSPIDSLVSTSSRDFGRSIELNLNLVTQGSVMLLKLRKRDTAVVMNVKHYEEILHFKALYEELVEHAKGSKMEDETSEYEALYQRVSSAQSRKAADHLFSASSADLHKTYKQGKTEST
jgi:hypothetical protein